MRFNFDRCSTFEYGEHKSVNLASVGDCTKITDTVQRLVYLFNTLEHEGQQLVSLNLVQTSSGCHRHREDSSWRSGFHGLFTDNLLKITLLDEQKQPNEKQERVSGKSASGL